MRTLREQSPVHRTPSNRAEPRWLAVLLAVLVALCLALAAFVWWRLLSALP